MTHSLENARIIENLKRELTKNIKDPKKGFSCQYF